MKNFDRANLKTLRNDLDAALTAVAAKHGIEINLGNIRFSSTEARCSMTCQTKIDAKEIVDCGSAVEQAALYAFERYGSEQVPTISTSLQRALQRAMITNRIASTTNRKGDVLTGYYPNRPSYPFTYTGSKGGRWMCSSEQARERFGSLAVGS